ncbi:MAG: ATP-dependent Clp protease proteolytic subunit [Phycisphaerae bacterium]|nr:ATP-dependent Clp protease proteolytic subunit [Phycisphaerae bacterium]
MPRILCLLLLVIGAAATGWFIHSQSPVMAQDADLDALTSTDQWSEVLDTFAEDFLDYYIAKEHSGADIAHPDDPLLKQLRTIIVDGEMNEQMTRQVAARLLYLNQLDSSKPIQLYLVSQGGYADDTFFLSDLMHTLSAPVNITVGGGCYSACVDLLVAATGLRQALPHTIIAIHINPSDDPDEVEFDRERDERYYRLYTRLPESCYPMDEEKWYYLTSEQAIEWGVIDQVTEIQPPARPASTQPASQQ